LIIDEKFFDQIDKAILITNADIEPWNPLIVYVNPTFCNMSGYKKEELLGKTPKIFQGALSDKAVLSRLKDGLLKNGVFEASTVNYKKTEVCTGWSGPYPPSSTKTANFNTSFRFSKI